MAACQRVLGALAVLLTIASLAQGQSVQGQYSWASYNHSSGVHTNAGNVPAVMDSTVITLPGATSIRLFFAVAQLGPEDCIEVISNLDGNRQFLFPHELVKWSYSSAYFNGSSVTVRLWVNAGSTANYSINEVIVGVPAGTNGAPETICGSTDDRILSQDWRAMRAVSNPSGTSGGCTIWAANSGNCVLSAGHCTSTFGVAEAEVPLSTSSGAAQHPPANRQWPITNLDFVDGGTGNDWAVNTLSPNAQNELPSQLYGWFPLSFSVPNANDTIRITGYGTVSSPVSSTWYVVNKTHTGPFVALTGSTTLTYATDTTGGNSGSPVIDEATGQAVGIHTHAGCNSTGGANQGTSLTLGAFQTAWNLACGTPTAPTASFSSSNPNILQGGSVSFTDGSTGIPSSWAWDLDGDGLVDSTAQNPSFTYNTVGSFNVTLTVTNAIGSDTVTMNGYVNVSGLTPASLPYSQDFNGGLPSQGSTGWVFTSNNGFGRIAAGSNGTASPLSGGLALTMDSNTDGNYATNDATLVVALASAGSGILSYNIKETGDEDDAEDGLWISDGTNEALIQAHTGSFSAWTSYTIDLVAAAQANGINVTDSFRIIWRQRDNFGIPTDGHLVDDIDISVPVANPYTLVMTSTGAGDLFLQGQNTPAGTVRGYTLFSFDTSNPVGQGTIYGITADLLTFTVILRAPQPGDPFHWTYPNPGLYPDAAFVLPPGAIASGTVVDGQLIAFDTFSVIGVSNAVRLTF